MKDSVETLRTKMSQKEIDSRVIDLFLFYYESLVSGQRGVIKEDDLESVPAGSLPRLNICKPYLAEGKELLSQCAMIKLNGGLGTSMGLSSPKSFLPVKNTRRFIDIVSDQICALRAEYSAEIPLVFMNSEATEQQTNEYLAQCPEIRIPGIPLCLNHNSYPKILVDTLEPASYPENPACEWNPAGHGDFYMSLFTTGVLDALLSRGIHYAFISNIDNLGATLDVSILGYMASQEIPFLMEVVARREMDKKGGHIAQLHDKRLVLRERAQTVESELDAFEDIDRYGYFNSNSMWIDLRFLRRLFNDCGLLKLPLIANRKTLDPNNKSTPAVYQIETAMGSALSLFDGAQALEIPENRFRPVKKNDDLLLLWSDRFTLNNSGEIVATEGCTSEIMLSLDSIIFASYTDFALRVKEYPPSLKNCNRLDVIGDIYFGENCVCEGNVQLINRSGSSVIVQHCVYCDETVIF